jgi:hypothetical protein
VATSHTEGPGETWMHWEAPYEDTPPPPPGGGRGPDHGQPRLDLQPIFMVLEALRRGVPKELEDQLNALIREILLTLRALIDWYLDRLDNAPAEPTVEDIPID